jgi:HAD superfamily hydrolase (TIGR01509 family)
MNLYFIKQEVLMSKPVHALLFDLDGTLIDTGELHYYATVEALKTFSKSIDRKEYDQHIHGNNNTDIANYFFPDGNEEIHNSYVDRKESLFRKILEPMPPISGLSKILEWARQHDIKTGLVTNAPKENKDSMLEAIDLAEQFHPVILGDDLPRGKPDPLPFHTALEILDIEPAHAIGFDDSVHGIQAVAAAGMYAVGIETGLSAEELIKNGADITIRDYDAPELIDILQTRLSFNF